MQDGVKGGRGGGGEGVVLHAGHTIDGNGHIHYTHA